MNLYNPQQNQLKTIKLLLEQLLHQTSVLEQQDQPLRRLDLDVMLKRTHKLYETLCDIPVKHERIELQEEKLSQTKNIVAPAVEKVTPPPPKQEEKIEEKIVEKTPEVRPVEPKPERLPEPMPVPKPPQEKPVPETHAEAELKKEIEKPKNQKSTTTSLDLFAEDVAPSVADQLQRQSDKSVGAKIGRQPIEEIRTAIGINDKFLFINELFSGSLESYNKMLDELNEFKSFNGATTYLIELKVVNQWDGNSEAWHKLVGLIERKFNIDPEDHAL